MKLTVLAENTACRNDLTAQHGLSLYLETADRKILFDMGQSDVFARNAEVLGIDLSKVDFAVISHGHYDHGGGLETFLKINPNAPVYIHRLAFGEHYNGKEKYIGLNPALRAGSRLIFTEGTLFPASGIKLTDCNTHLWDFNSWGLCRREGEKLFPDPFFHEQYMEITEGNRRILISGCSHKGIVNIAEHFQPDVLVGGFHLNKLEDTDQLCTIAETLKQTGTLYYTGHCTGEGQFAVMKRILGAKLQRMTTGLTIEI